MKYPKLEITKFNGTHLDWTRFWNQFSVEIDSSGLASVTKSSYLKEFLELMVRSIIDGLPFTFEGYNGVKSILGGKYGNPSEVVDAQIQSIMNLPYIGNADPYKIHRFYEKLQTQYTGKYGYNSVNKRENMDQRKPEFEIFHPVRTVTISVMFISI